MKRTASTGVITALAILIGLPAAQAGAHSEQLVVGNSQGNHELNCLVIRPWSDEDGPDDVQYPIIGWANGWDQGNVLGQTTTQGYKPGLIEWALDGPYIVIAANAWSAREVDLVQCLEWLVDQNWTPGSEYEGRVNWDRIGVAGHSQGGGAAAKTGDGGLSDLDLAGIIPMNPYGPNWPSVGSLIAPLFLLGGDADTTTPVASYIELWQDALLNDQGGIFAVLPDGTHNSDAWGEDAEGNTLSNAEAALFDFGRYQRPTELFWDFVLNDNKNAGRSLKRLLNKKPWVTEYHITEGFQP